MGNPTVHTKLLSLLLLVSLFGCQTRNRKEMVENKSNPLLCNPEKGFCEVPANVGSGIMPTQPVAKKLKVIYFTDPICSACWGIEPQLRKLKLEYGKYIDLEYHMGGLLPDWSYNSGGISKPSDVAHHWDEVSQYYDMPIDGDVWLEDPLPSSYPPSIAFKAAEIQDGEKALLFLREAREMVFLQKKNITKWEYLSQAADRAGLNLEQFKADYEGKAKALFEEDLRMAREMGVRGFPTLFFVEEDKREIVYGVRPYSGIEAVVKKLAPEAVKATYNTSAEGVFAIYPTLTAKEFSELTGTPRGKAEGVLDEMTNKGSLEKWTTKNGAIWMSKASE